MVPCADQVACSSGCAAAEATGVPIDSSGAPTSAVGGGGGGATQGHAHSHKRAREAYDDVGRRRQEPATTAASATPPSAGEWSSVSSEAELAVAHARRKAKALPTARERLAAKLSATARATASANAAHAISNNERMHRSRHNGW